MGFNSGFKGLNNNNNNNNKNNKNNNNFKAKNATLLLSSAERPI